MNHFPKYLKAAALTISLFFCLPIAKADSAAAQDLANLLENFQSMKANFEQVIYDQKQRPLQKNVGNMALKRPNKFRWEVKRPTPQLLLTDGSHFWIYDIDLEQATQQKADSHNSSSPASLLSGSVNDLEKRFNVSYVKKSGNGKWFKLVPADQDDMFQWVELGFENGQLSGMRLSDKLGALSSFTFSNVQINPQLSADLFVFKAPKGVELIKN